MIKGFVQGVAGFGIVKGGVQGVGVGFRVCSIPHKYITMCVYIYVPVFSHLTAWLVKYVIVVCLPQKERAAAVISSWNDPDKARLMRLILQPCLAPSGCCASRSPHAASADCAKRQDWE